MTYLFRFNILSEVGQNRGLDLILDAHTNLVTKSSVIDSFQVKTCEERPQTWKLCYVYFEKNSPVKYLTYNCEDESQVFFSGLSGTH